MNYPQKKSHTHHTFNDAGVFFIFVVSYAHKKNFAAVAFKGAGVVFLFDLFDGRFRLLAPL